MDKDVVSITKIDSDVDINMASSEIVKKIQTSPVRLHRKNEIFECSEFFSTGFQPVIKDKNVEHADHMQIHLTKVVDESEYETDIDIKKIPISNSNFFPISCWEATPQSSNTLLPMTLQLLPSDAFNIKESTKDAFNYDKATLKFTDQCSVNNDRASSILNLNHFETLKDNLGLNSANRHHLFAEKSDEILFCSKSCGDPSEIPDIVMEDHDIANHESINRQIQSRKNKEADMNKSNTTRNKDSTYSRNVRLANGFSYETLPYRSPSSDSKNSHNKDDSIDFKKINVPLYGSEIHKKDCDDLENVQLPVSEDNINIVRNDFPENGLFEEESVKSIADIKIKTVDCVENCSNSEYLRQSSKQLPIIKSQFYNFTQDNHKADCFSDTLPEKDDTIINSEDGDKINILTSNKIGIQPQKKVALNSYISFDLSESNFGGNFIGNNQYRSDDEFKSPRCNTLDSVSATRFYPNGENPVDGKEDLADINCIINSVNGSGSKGRLKRSNSQSDKGSNQEFGRSLQYSRDFVENKDQLKNKIVTNTTPQKEEELGVHKDQAKLLEQNVQNSSDILMEVLTEQTTYTKKQKEHIDWMNNLSIDNITSFRLNHSQISEIHKQFESAYTQSDHGSIQYLKQSFKIEDTLSSNKKYSSGMNLGNKTKVTSQFNTNKIFAAETSNQADLSVIDDTSEPQLDKISSITNDLEHPDRKFQNCRKFTDEKIIEDTSGIGINHDAKSGLDNPEHPVQNQNMTPYSFLNPVVHRNRKTSDRKTSWSQYSTNSDMFEYTKGHLGSESTIAFGKNPSTHKRLSDEFSPQHADKLSSVKNEIMPDKLIGCFSFKSLTSNLLSQNCPIKTNLLFEGDKLQDSNDYIKTIKSDYLLNENSNSDAKFDNKNKSPDKYVSNPIEIASTNFPKKSLELYDNMDNLIVIQDLQDRISNAMCKPSIWKDKLYCNFSKIGLLQNFICPIAKKQPIELDSIPRNYFLIIQKNKNTNRKKAIDFNIGNSDRFVRTENLQELLALKHKLDLKKTKLQEMSIFENLDQIGFEFVESKNEFYKHKDIQIDNLTENPIYDDTIQQASSKELNSVKNLLQNKLSSGKSICDNIESIFEEVKANNPKLKDYIKDSFSKTHVSIDEREREFIKQTVENYKAVECEYKIIKEKLSNELQVYYKSQGDQNNCDELSVTKLQSLINTMDDLFNKNNQGEVFKQWRSSVEHCQKFEDIRQSVDQCELRICLNNFGNGEKFKNNPLVLKASDPHKEKLVEESKEVLVLDERRQSNLTDFRGIISHGNNSLGKQYDTVSSNPTMINDNRPKNYFRDNEADGSHNKNDQNSFGGDIIGKINCLRKIQSNTPEYTDTPCSQTVAEKQANPSVTI